MKGQGHLILIFDQFIFNTDLNLSFYNEYISPVIGMLILLLVDLYEL